VGKPLSSYQQGERLPALELPPLTRHMLALYCGGSGDHNPLHTDIDFAREAAGLPDVIGHGMLTMAFAGRLLTGIAGPESLRSFSVRFVGMTHIRDVLICQGMIEQRLVMDSGTRFIVGICIVTADGRTVLTGQAAIDIEARAGRKRTA
jgi:acyl dehydratase